MNLKSHYPNIVRSEWKYIFKKRPDLRKIPEPSLDVVIVDFLKQYDVFIKPVTSGTKNRGDAAISGAITGFAGADVGGDAFLISGQKKQTAVQEWTQWKQWALDHKEFSAFRDSQLNQEAKEHNARIDALLSSQKVKDEINFLISQKRTTDKNISLFFIAVIAIFVGIGAILKGPNQYPSAVRYSDFIESVKNGQVNTLFLSPDSGTAQVIGADGSKYEVNLAPDEDLLGVLKKHNVEIRVTQ